MLMQAALLNVVPGLDICIMADGDELLPRLQEAQRSPRLILLDLNMPHIGGFEALATLRSENKYGQLPVVVLTTSSNPADRRKSEALGANGFHTKPATFVALTQLARQLVGQWLGADNYD